jgi:lysozyme
MDVVTLLANQEGYRRFAYRDTVGKLTIGIGRNLEAEGVSVLEARYMLTADIDRVVQRLKVLPFWGEIGAIRQAALISVAINCGVDGLLEFHATLAALGATNYGLAGAQLMQSRAARELPTRYKALASMLATSQWPIE